MHPRTRARLLALRALAQLETSELGLNAILEGLNGPPESLGFARELASGATRWRSRLDWTLAPLLAKPLEKLDAPVRAALRLAMYERVVLETRASAVANEYAGLMREVRLKSAVGFVNAIARRLPSTWREPPRGENPARLAIETAHPEWMAARWIERFGFEEAESLCRANNFVAPLDLRVNTARTSRAQVLEALQERGVGAQASDLSPHNIRLVREKRSHQEPEKPEKSDSQVLEGAADASQSPWRWPEWEAGLLLAQDEAAQLVALALDAPRGERILDIASAPGGKATHLAQLGGRLTCADRSGARLQKVRDNFARLDLQADFFVGDAAQVLGAVEEGKMKRFGRVLLDAPCTGTGTLRRRPDAKWRKSMENLGEMIALQRDLLDIAAACVAPNGLLAYSTCSLEEEENAAQVRDFLGRHPQWKLEAPSTRWVGEELWRRLGAAEDLPGAIATIPSRDGCDGMFCALMRRGE